MGRGRRSKKQSWDERDYLHQKYVTEELSFGAIAKLHDTFSNSVRRAAIRHGIEQRTKSTAQKKFLDNNNHPMLGRERTAQEKEKISQGVQFYWECLDPDEAEQLRDEMSERAKLKWDWMSEEEKQKTIMEMHRANREKSGCGSKNENAVRELLIKGGYNALERTTEFSPRKQFEIDIPIPGESMAIEWDGVAHFVPIYGDEALEKVIEKDGRKNKALVQHGWTVIRVRDHSTSHSSAFCRRAVGQIVEIIKSGDRKIVHYVDAE